MEHEPECIVPWQRECICKELRAAYQRGRAFQEHIGLEYGKRMYREGYNDHARTIQHWQDTHGAYLQHGTGENP